MGRRCRIPSVMWRRGTWPQDTRATSAFPQRTAEGSFEKPAHDRRTSPPRPFGPHLHLAVEEGPHRVWLRLEQVNRLDEALHDIHHKWPIGGDQFASGREYRWCIKGIYREGIPPM